MGDATQEGVADRAADDRQIAARIGEGAGDGGDDGVRGELLEARETLGHVQHAFEPNRGR